MSETRKIYIEVVLDDKGANATLTKLDNTEKQLTQSSLQTDAAFKKLSGSLGEVSKAAVVTQASATAIAQGYIQAAKASAQYYDSMRQVASSTANMTTGLNGATQRAMALKTELYALARGGVLAKTEIEKTGGVAKLSAGSLDIMSTRVAASIKAYTELGRQAPASLVRLQQAILRTQAANAASQSSFDQLKAKLQGVTDATTKGVAAQTAYQRATQATGQAVRTLTEGAMVRAVAIGTMLGNMFYDLARNAVSSFIGIIGQAISESSRFNNALIGLETVAKKFRQDVNETSEAARELASDGLMTVAEAALGLKNLLATGFGLPEAIKLMKGFKDSASFNRQGMYELGYAVVTATEGIKNQNSILVDNAGLTKNLSVIMREVGLDIKDMGKISSDAAIRGKFLGGLMKELSLFTGDAAKYTETYAGAVSKLKSQWTLALVALGDAVVKNKEVAKFISMTGEGIKVLTQFLDENQATVSGWVSGAANALISIVQTLKDLWKEWGDTIIWVADNIVAEGYKVAKEDLEALANALRTVKRALDELTGGMVSGIIDTAFKAFGANIFKLITEPFLRAMVVIQMTKDAMQELAWLMQRIADIGKDSTPKIANRPFATPGLYNPLLGGAELPKDAKMFGPTLDEIKGPPAPPVKSDADKDAERLSKQLKELVKDLKAAEKIQQSIFNTPAMNAGLLNATDIIDKYGSSINNVVFEAKLAGRTIPAEILKWKAASDQADLAAVMLNIAKVTKDIARPETEKFWKEQERLADDTMKAVASNYQIGKDAYVEYTETIRQRSMSSKQVQIRNMELARDAEIGLLDIRVANWGEAANNIRLKWGLAIQATTTAGIDAAVREKKDLQDRAKDARATYEAMKNYAIKGFFSNQEIERARQEMVEADKRAAGKFRDSWGEALDGLAAAFTQLAQIAGDKIGKVVGLIANLVVSLKNARDAGKAMKDAMAGEGTDWGKMLGGIAQGIAAIDQATSTGNKTMNVIGGAAAGAQLGSATGIPGGTAIGAIIGGLVGLFRGAQKASQALKDQFARDMQSMRKEAQLAGADLQRAFNAKYAKEFEQAVKDVEEALRNYNKQLEQIGSASEGLNKRVEGFGAPFIRQLDEIARRQKELDDFKADDRNYEAPEEGDAGGYGPKYDQAAKELEDLKRKAKESAGAAKDEFERMGQFALMQFGVVLKMTGSIFQAFTQVGGALDTLIRLQKEMGLEASTAVQNLLDLREVANANADVMLSIEGITQMLKGLMEAGQLNATQFQLFATDAATLFQKLMDGGASSNQAMLLMQPTLQLLWEGQEKYGAIADETTKKLVDQAAEQGIVGANMKSVNERIFDVLLLIAEVLGATIPDAFKKADKASEDAANSVKGDWERARDEARRYGDTVRGLPTIPSVEGPEPSTQSPSYHSGGVIRAHAGMFLGSRAGAGSGLKAGEVPIIAQTGEYVMSRKGVKATGLSTLDRMNKGGGFVTGSGGGSGGGTTQTFNITLGEGAITTIDRSGFDNEEVAEGIMAAISKRVDGRSKSAIRFVGSVGRVGRESGGRFRGVK